MARTGGDLEYHVLSLLERHPQGVGSGALLHSLLDLGIQVSQPTVSRLLNTLDHRGLTQKVSNKGRVLTPRGISWLEQVRHRQQRVRWVERIMAAVEPSTLDELRDVLVARRALENEIARLAADHATVEQIAQMREAVEQQRRAVETSAESNAAALHFHRILAEACSNSFLALAGDALRNERHVLEVIMYHLGSTVGGESLVSHGQILEAVVSRDPSAAGRAMTRHMNQYIRYVDHLRAEPRIRLAGGRLPTASETSDRSDQEPEPTFESGSRIDF